LQVYLSKFSGETKDFSDSASDILLYIFESIHKYNGKNSFSTWLYTIARNKTIDQIRTKQIQTIDFSEFEPSHPNNPEGIYLEKIEKKRIKIAIERLSNRNQELIFLHFYEGLTYKEISNITGIPEGTVKYRMSESRKALKKDLERSLVK